MRGNGLSATLGGWHSDARSKHAAYLPTDFKYSEERASEQHQPNYAVDYLSSTEALGDGQDTERHHKRGWDAQGHQTTFLLASNHQINIEHLHLPGIRRRCRWGSLGQPLLTTSWRLASAQGVHHIDARPSRRSESRTLTGTPACCRADVETLVMTLGFASRKTRPL